MAASKPVIGPGHAAVGAAGVAAVAGLLWRRHRRRQAATTQDAAPPSLTVPITVNPVAPPAAPAPSTPTPATPAPNPPAVPGPATPTVVASRLQIRTLDRATFRKLKVSTALAMQAAGKAAGASLARQANPGDPNMLLGDLRSAIGGSPVEPVPLAWRRTTTGQWVPRAESRMVAGPESAWRWRLGVDAIRYRMGAVFLRDFLTDGMDPDRAAGVGWHKPSLGRGTTPRPATTDDGVWQAFYSPMPITSGPRAGRYAISDDGPDYLTFWPVPGKIAPTADPSSPAAADACWTGTLVSGGYRRSSPITSRYGGPCQGLVDTSAFSVAAGALSALHGSRLGSTGIRIRLPVPAYCRGAVDEFGYDRGYYVPNTTCAAVVIRDPAMRFQAGGMTSGTTHFTDDDWMVHPTVIYGYWMWREFIDQIAPYLAWGFLSTACGTSAIEEDDAVGRAFARALLDDGLLDLIGNAAHLTVQERGHLATILRDAWRMQTQWPQACPKPDRDFWDDFTSAAALIAPIVAATLVAGPAGFVAATVGVAASQIGGAIGGAGGSIFAAAAGTLVSTAITDPGKLSATADAFRGAFSRLSTVTLDEVSQWVEDSAQDLKQALIDRALDGATNPVAAALDAQRALVSLDATVHQGIEFAVANTQTKFAMLDSGVVAVQDRAAGAGLLMAPDGSVVFTNLAGDVLGQISADLRTVSDQATAAEAAAARGARTEAATAAVAAQAAADHAHQIAGSGGTAQLLLAQIDDHLQRALAAASA